MKNQVANNIRVLRQRKGLSQESLSEAMKLTRSRIGGWEESRNEPCIKMLIKLSQFFRVSLTKLITYKFK